MVNSNVTSKPIAQYGSSEAVSSAAWFREGSPLLAAGMGLKWIKIFDLRSMYFSVIHS